MYNSELSENRLGAWRDSLFVDHAVFRLMWTNWAEVIPGRLYRSNHPTPARLAAAARRYGLRTLINLRGHRQCGSDALSRDAATRLGLIHIDMAFESRGAPHRDRILRFHDIWQNLATPALRHCKSGADRAWTSVRSSRIVRRGQCSRGRCSAWLALRPLQPFPDRHTRCLLSVV